jgi:HEAT repeat protein
LVKAEPDTDTLPPPATAADTLPRLVALLASSNAADRRAAVHGLEVLDDGIDPLCRRIAEEPVPSVREAIMAALIRRRSPTVAAALLPLLRSELPPLRNAALEGLAAMPDEVAPHIEQLLRDPDSDVRIFTANLLHVLPHKRAADWLQIALADDHANVCAAAIDGLAEIGGEEALPALVAVADRFPGDDFIAFAAQIAIQRIGRC